ncbi:MAG: SRPBCC domain-containing protein [Bacteroidetes bacterium]|nr:SRPBCC domain-containing protein [Bacteroidota bacterium]
MLKEEKSRKAGENKNYNATIVVSQTAGEAFKSINNVTKWWTENLEGSSHKLNDVFTLLWGGKSFVTIKIVEFVSDQKVVWQVTDSYLEWLTDKMEWQNTKMSFEISTRDNKTEIYFTHIGLVPKVECYNDCVKGWDQYVKGSLVKLITEGKGQPQLKK